MIRQYRAHRRRSGLNPIDAGVVAIGSICHLQDHGRFHDYERRCHGMSYASGETHFLNVKFLRGESEDAR